MKKLSGRSGFTLAELLASMLIMLLASGLVVQTLTLAVQQYQSRIQANDAQEYYTQIAEVLRGYLEVQTTAKVNSSNILDGFPKTDNNGTTTLPATVAAEITVSVKGTTSVNGTDYVDYYTVSVTITPPGNSSNKLVNSSFIVRPILNHVEIELSP